MKILRGTVSYDEGHYREANSVGIYQVAQGSKILYRVTFSDSSHNNETFVMCGLYENFKTALKIRDLYYYIFRADRKGNRVKPYRSEFHYQKLASLYYKGSMPKMLRALVEKGDLTKWQRDGSGNTVNVRDLL